MSESLPVVEWMATGRALRATGLSRSTLHRWKHDGLLEEGIHFKPGATPKSPTRWNVSAIEDAIRARRALPLRPSSGAKE